MSISGQPRLLRGPGCSGHADLLRAVDVDEALGDDEHGVGAFLLEAGAGPSQPALRRWRASGTSRSVGGGVKFYATRRIVVRLDVVDNVATAYGVGNARSNNLEVLLGLSLRLGAKSQPKPVQPLRDTDLDGLYDPGQPGVLPADDRGCPLIDSDGDGLYDPGQPVAAEMVDACPSEPGPRELQGCPDRDRDQIIDKKDKCPDQPEVYNQIADSDGCPDEVPKEIKKFVGVIAGIYFDVDRDTIKPKSKPVLDNAVKVLSQFPETRWIIEGHAIVRSRRRRSRGSSGAGSAAIAALAWARARAGSSGASERARARWARVRRRSAGRSGRSVNAATACASSKSSPTPTKSLGSFTAPALRARSYSSPVDRASLLTARARCPHVARRASPVEETRSTTAACLTSPANPC